MILRRLLTITILLTSTIWSQAQQINPVPDYVFRNQMSVGRNAVTDTAAYFSIGPRYGATKGFMPPIVGDTATFSSGKRNGLLIFSVQKNKFLYWDSVRVQWSDMAGSSGSYIVAGDTSAMLAPYLRKSDTTSMLTAYLRKGDTASMLSPYYRSATASAALALKLNISDTASMLSPYYRSATATAALATKLNISDTATMLSPYYRSATATAALATKLNISDTSSMLGNYIRHAGYGLTKSGQSFLVDTLNIATRAWRQKGLDSLAALEVSGSGTTNYVPKFTAGSTIGNSQIQDNGSGVGIGVNPDSSLKLYVRPNSTTGTAIYSDNGANSGFFVKYNGAITNIGNDFNAPLALFTNNTERLRIFANGRVFVGASPTDAGYQLDVNGTLRTVNGANFATTSGSIGIGTASPSASSKVTISTATGYGIELDNTATGGLKWQIGSSADDFGAGGGKFLITYGNNSLVSPFTIVQSTSNIGISTTSPSYKLDINGTLRSVNGANFATTSGNVGIGTASPQQILHANATTGAYIQLSRTAQGGTTSPFGGIYFGDGTTFQEAAILSGADGNVVSGNMAFYTRAAAGSLLEGFRVNSTQEMLVGGGSDAGDYKLQVAGNIYNTGSAVLAATSGEVSIGSTSTTTAAGYKWLRINGTTGGVIELTSGDARVIQMQADGTTAGGRLATITSSPLIFGTAATNRMRVTADGEIYINTETDAGDYKLQVSGNIYNTGSAVLAATSGNVGIGTASPLSIFNIQQNSDGFTSGITVTRTGATRGTIFLDATNDTYNFTRGGAAGAGITLNSSAEVLINTTTDAGDYKLQVVGNARIGTGKLDIASNTTFGIGIARSGTSEVAGQIYNSNGILYLGAESSAGGQIFSGSSAYAGVIGTGANYPLQFAVNNITRGGFSTSGNLLLGFTTDSYFLKLQVNGSIFSNNQFFGQGANAQLSIDSSTNISPLYVSAHSLTGTSAQAMLYSNTTWNTTGNPSLLDLNITNTASGATSNYIKITDGTNTFRVTKAAEVVTAAPSGGSIKPWKLGEAATVSPTSPNRTIRVEIDGTVYYLHAKTTND